MVRMDLITRAKWDAQKALLVSETQGGHTRVRVVKLRQTFSAMLQADAERTILEQCRTAWPRIIKLNIRENQNIQN